jgi:hypothetical protein
MQTLDVWEMGYLTAFLHVPAISVKKIGPLPTQDLVTNYFTWGYVVMALGLCVKWTLDFVKVSEALAGFM